jgi:hypothetical protein
MVIGVFCTLFSGAGVHVSWEQERPGGQAEPQQAPPVPQGGGVIVQCSPICSGAGVLVSWEQERPGGQAEPQQAPPVPQGEV